ncbi:hypothetical protein TERTU_2222 [Teredinibacter turnerae T7901]|uniref:Uncharacterized protein n=1 Tax=Teredinibacter turnerae (strain ATCC 39867 / T7901) TaxID=377629 RepID=C5BJJ8_TERTT|nr:hypothetical protein TERTU_2222 [Teredinibacter turnerae T7901]
MQGSLFEIFIAILTRADFLIKVNLVSSKICLCSPQNGNFE